MEGLDELRGIRGFPSVGNFERVQVKIAGKKRETRSAEQFHFLDFVGRESLLDKHEIDEFLLDAPSEFGSDGGFRVFFGNDRVDGEGSFRKSRHAFQALFVGPVLAKIEIYRVRKERIQAFFRAGGFRVDGKVGKVGRRRENAYGVVVRINGSARNRVLNGNGLLAVGQSTVVVVFEHRVLERSPNDEKSVGEKRVRDNLDPVGAGNEGDEAVENVAEIVFHRFRRFRVSNPLLRREP